MPITGVEEERDPPSHYNSSDPRTTTITGITKEMSDATAIARRQIVILAELNTNGGRSESILTKFKELLKVFCKSKYIHAGIFNILEA